MGILNPWNLQLILEKREGAGGRRRRRRHRLRRRDRDGARLRRRAHEHRGREGAESGADGAGDEKGGRGRARGLPRRPHAEEALFRRRPSSPTARPDRQAAEVLQRGPGADRARPRPAAPPPIRSYVLRQGRVSDAQRARGRTLLPVYGIAFSPGAARPRARVRPRAPKILEIGFGMGETTAAIAQAHPENDYLGIEVHTPGVGSLLQAHRRSRRPDELRVIQHDAVEVLEHMIAPGALDGVHVFFPDPWPKKRHHKRRLIQPEFVASARHAHEAGRLPARRDRLGGLRGADARSAVGRAAAREHRDGIRAAAGLAPAHEVRDPRPRLGHGVWDLVFRRR